eukprot:c24473_g3_i1 orf=272-2422(-)
MGADTELPRNALPASREDMGSQNGSESGFPAGLRVLVVDDDRICLLILDRMLRECLYKVTTCERAADALKLLRENRDGFDVVISDVHMPDMDGFKLLEDVGLEMDLPVIMMSANGETSAVMKGIKHGACDYLLKPVRIEELKNIWQHVIRRKRRDVDSDDRHRLDDGGDGLANDGLDGTLKNTKKRKDSQEEDDDIELENDDPATSKKPRVVWSVDLHQKFVNAVNQLGIDKAVPKRILELMDVRGLTRENVASHLQKYRLYLKRISGVALQASGAGFFGGNDERFMSTGAGLGDFRTHLSPHALVSSLHPGLLDRVGPNSPDPFFLGQVTIHGINNGSTVRPPYGAPLLNAGNVLDSAVSSGLDFRHLGRGIGQLVPHGHADKVPSLPLSAGAHMERLIGHDNHFLGDHSNKSLLMQMLQQQNNQQMASGMLSETQINAQHMPSSDVGSNLSTSNSSLNTLSTFCRPSPDIATLSNSSFETSSGLAAFRKTKAVDARTYSNVPQVGISNYTLSSSVPSQSVSHGNELGSVLSGKGGGLVCNASEDRNQGLQAVLSDQMTGGNAAFRLGAGFNKWQNWHGVGSNQDIGGQSCISLVNSNYNQGSTPGQAPKLGYMQEQKSGWIPKFHSDLVDDIDTKPLAASTTPSFEQGLGERDQLKAVPLEPLLGSKAGVISEAFPSSEDLLTCYLKQQQQEMMSLNEGDVTTEGYTLGNMYVK